MNQRLNGVVYRGNAVYYTFQRAATGASYLRRLKTRGKDLKDFHVTYLVDDKEQKKTSAQFLAVADKMKPNAAASKNGSSKSKKVVIPAKKSAAKPKAKKPIKVSEPVLET